MSAVAADFRAVAGGFVPPCESLARQSGLAAAVAAWTLGLLARWQLAIAELSERSSRANERMRASKPKRGAGHHTGHEKKRKRVGTPFVVSAFSFSVFFRWLARRCIVPPFLAGFVCLGLPCASMLNKYYKTVCDSSVLPGWW